MTIQELIEILKQFNPNTLVVVAGYHHGYNDISKIQPINIELNVNQSWDSGAHSLANFTASNPISAVFLGGYNNNIPNALDD
ncbi:MAG: hypothetical protein ACOC04_05215 [Halothece sp.]